MLRLRKRIHGGRRHCRLPRVWYRAYHRECWLKENKCANESYHASGKKWQRIGIPSSEQETVICPVCRFPNTPEDEKCRRCGTDLKTGKAPEFFGENENSDRGFIDEETITFDFAGFDPEEDFGGVKLRDTILFRCYEHYLLHSHFQANEGLRHEIFVQPRLPCIPVTLFRKPKNVGLGCICRSSQHCDEPSARHSVHG